MTTKSPKLAFAVATTLCCSLLVTSIASSSSSSSASASERSADEKAELETLRNTVVNLLEGLVQKGVLTREQAQSMVEDAQDKAAAQAKVREDQEATERTAVRVTHVPEIVKDQIREQVRQQLKQEVTKDVMEQAKKEKWGIPGSLPEWVGNLTFSGDLRLRAQSDDYAEDNAVNVYPDFSAINRSGGIAKAGVSALLNTTEDRLRERIRLRLGVDANIAGGVSAGIRLATGNITDPVSTNQTLGQSSARYAVAVDQAYLRFDTNSNSDSNSKSGVPWLTVVGGRMPNPWHSSELVWDPDLQFEGLASIFRVNFGGSTAKPRNIYFTAGAFPLQEFELTTKDKWLYGGQLGTDLSSNLSSGLSSNAGLRARLAVAYYYFDNITGIRNTPDSFLTDFTAPQFIQKGNTLYSIRNDADPTTDLFALAARYHVQSATLGLDWTVRKHKIMLNGEYIRNVGFDAEQILQLTGTAVEKRNTGYRVEVGFGTDDAKYRGNWRASMEYRYLLRDAMVDAFTDSDFHLGGTDAKGYVLKADWWFKDKTTLSLRYYSTNEIDGPPLGIDTMMLDLTGRF